MTKGVMWAEDGFGCDRCLFAGFWIGEHNLRGDTTAAHGGLAGGVEIKMDVMIGALWELEESARDP